MKNNCDNCSHNKFSKTGHWKRVNGKNCFIEDGMIYSTCDYNRPFTENCELFDQKKEMLNE